MARIFKSIKFEGLSLMLQCCLCPRVPWEGSSQYTHTTVCRNSSLINSWMASYSIDSILMRGPQKILTINKFKFFLFPFAHAQSTVQNFVYRNNHEADNKHLENCSPYDNYEPWRSSHPKFMWISWSVDRKSWPINQWAQITISVQLDWHQITIC